MGKMWMAGTSWCSLPSTAPMLSQSVKEGSKRLLRNHETGQEAVVQGQGTETENIGGEVAAGAEKGMGVIETGTIIARAEAEAEAEVRVQVRTTKVIVEQEMMISAGAGARVGAKAEAEAGVEATHTIVLHLLGAVLALTIAKAHHQGGAPLLKSTPMEKIFLHHAVFLHHQSMQAPVAQAVRARSKAC